MARLQKVCLTMPWITPGNTKFVHELKLLFSILLWLKLVKMTILKVQTFGSVFSTLIYRIFLHIV